MAKLKFLLFLPAVLSALALVQGKKEAESGSSGETDYDNASFFINSVHTVASEVAKNTVVNDDKVVWSPFSVVNVLSAHNLTENSTILQNGFNSATEYLSREQSSGLNVTQIQFGYTKNNELINETNSMFPMYPYPAYDGNLTDVIETKFAELTTGTVPNKTEEGPGHTSEDRLEIPRENVTTVYVTAMGLRASWETPFHPRYARRSRFFLNSTHTTKVKFYSNIGFYKYARFPELDNATGVAIPLKNAHKLYMIVLQPSTPEGIMNLSLTLDQTSNLTEILWARLRPRRVQLSIPKLHIDSQIPFIYSTNQNQNVTLMQLGSMTLTYTGITNNFTPDPQQRNVIPKFIRLRRRKEDKKFVANKPFIFLIYDSFAGILNYGIVLNPTDHIAHSMSFKPPPVILSPNGKLLSEVVTDFTEKVFQQERRVLDHQENFGVAGANLLRGLACYYSKCRNDTEKLMNLNLPMGFQEAFHELYNYSSTPPQAEGVSLIDVNSFGKCDEGPATDPFIVKNTPEDVQGEIINNTYALKLSVPVSKRNEKRFYLNELNFINANYVQYSGRVRYASYSPWDCKIIKIPTLTPQHYVYFLVPHEKSGVHVIEEGLEHTPLRKLFCQMRITSLRVRIPTFRIQSENYAINVTDFLGATSDKDPRVFQNVLLDMSDSDMDSEFHDFHDEEEEEEDDDEDDDDEEEDDVRDEASHSEESKEREGRKRGFRKKYRKVKIDRPFIVYVQDVVTGTVFMGRVNSAIPVIEEEPTTQNPEVEVTTIISSTESIPPK